MDDVLVIFVFVVRFGLGVSMAIRLLTQSQLTWIENCEDYMRLEYGDEVADSVRSCLAFVRCVLFVRKMAKILTASQNM